MADTLVKICGISTLEILAAAVKAGVDYVGLVHFEKSPRHLSLSQAARLRGLVPPQVKVVLLVVNLSPATLAEAVREVRPDVVQFHGQETPETLARFRAATGVEAWRALGVRDAGSLADAAQFHGAADRLLFDAPSSGLPGGNGTRFDWDLLKAYKAPTPWGLAGGLTPSNVADAIRLTGAPLVDTSSGVESAPGIKDVDKIAAFCKAAQQS
ncbi:phosphoribosylanthranilate isomerase [Erythromicrobium ramosum]|uniref:N-(5'-phosphoribosyl)anthranilate isomerase n=1 Tax=Erythrobacter ramosus TaxID=35811 RepID=A0A6I4UP93_9SPHN|nr:phosphoribosylanthranilate isomerase [Erythrobacter ramosus]MBB3775773.1 phosphoribosylanthranilate isomerase [Erythrobacter ramosus]MXP39135.1 phosphoribosylanthranilate isomerase [Erythrobacter ramosus]